MGAREIARPLVATLALLAIACGDDGSNAPDGASSTAAGRPTSPVDRESSAAATRGGAPSARADSASPDPARGVSSSARTEPATAARGAPSGDGWFVDVTAASGVDFVHEAGVTAEKHLPETMGAGGALLDMDGDGDLDLYLVQGGPLLATPAARPPNRLFANDGGGRFTDVTSSAGAAAHRGYGMGVVAGDVNGDGSADLVVTNLGPDALLLNDGDGRFVDASQRAGIADPRWTGGATLFDADGDGDLDLYVAAYVDADLNDPVWCGRREPGWRSYCHPDAYDGLPDRFWRNAGDGTFTDATAEAGLATKPGRHGKGLGAIATDVDGDGHLDLYIANDSTENRLWLNRGDGTFEDGTLLSGTGVNDRGLTEAGMGLAAGDVDDDGDPDLFVTNFDDESNTLYRNDGDGLFTDVTAAAGLDGKSRLPVGFGTVLADLDDDGDLDLAVANGHIIDNIHLYHDGKTHAQRALLFERRDGAFHDATAAAGDLTASSFVGRGLYDGDLDGDGDLDLVLTACGGAARIFANQRGGRSVALTGIAPGARLELTLGSGRRRVLEAGPWPSYFGQTSPRVHVGLGDDEVVALTLTNPGGAPETVALPGALTGGPYTLRRDAAGLRLQSAAPAVTIPPPSPHTGDHPR